MFNARSLFTSIALVCCLAGAASAQVDAQAKAALEESAKAIKGAPGMTFKMKRWMDGVPMLKLGGEGEFQFVRTATPATTMGYHFKGKTDIPSEGERETEVLTYDGAWITWVDAGKKTVFEQPLGANSEAAGVAFRTKTVLLPPPLVDDEPYALELKAGQIIMEPAAEVKGEACQVVRCILKAGDAERLIYISAVDRLPRRFEQIKVLGNGKMSPVWEMWDLKTEKHDLAKMKVTTPKGFAYEKKEASATPPQPNTTTIPGKTDPKVLGPVLPTGLLRVGADAPAFDLAPIGKGEKVSLASLKGNTVVLTFWGTRFPDSLEMIPVLEEVSKAVAGKPVKVFSIASREESPEIPAKWLESAKPTTPALLAAQATPDAYGVRGFPSTVILDAEGKVVKCFEGPIDSKSILAALAPAPKPAK